jgi:hypothetical protein
MMIPTAFNGIRKQSFRDWRLIILVAALSVGRAIYLLSYPFLIEGDGYTYYELLQDFHSHLLHATGYVFFSSIAAKPISNLLFIEPAEVLRYFQQGLSIVALAFLYLALRRIVPASLGFTICLVLGMDAYAITAAGTTRPEFLQANIVMFLVGVCIFGLNSEDDTRKKLFYAAAGLFFMAGFLTKYNFIACLLFCATPIFDRKMNWQRRLRLLTCSIVGAGLLLGIFLFGFHYPTTGTFRLNLEHGWIYLLKLQESKIPLLPENGIATQKYRILADHLPPVVAGPSLWRSINEVPKRIRSPFRQAWSPLISSTDKAYVWALFAESSSSRSMITNYHDPNVFCSLYYYLGLKEAEKLLSQVYWEGLRTYPERYLANVWKAFLEGTDFQTKYIPYLPVPGIYDPPSFEYTHTRFLTHRRSVFKTVEWSLMQSSDVNDLSAQIWFPGAKLLSFFAFLRYTPSEFVWVAMLAGLIPIGLSLIRRRSLKAAELLFVLAFTALLGVMALSAVLLEFRSKELIFCQPLIYIAVALSVFLWTEWLTSFWPERRSQMAL